MRIWYCILLINFGISFWICDSWTILLLFFFPENEREKLDLDCIRDVYEDEEFFKSDLETYCYEDIYPDDERYKSRKVCLCRGSFCNSPAVPGGTLSIFYWAHTLF